MTSDSIEVDVQSKIVVKLGLAQAHLNDAYELGLEANPLAKELEVFKQMAAVVFGLSKMIGEMQKLRFK